MRDHLPQIDLAAVRGASAKCIAAHLTGLAKPTGDYPHDGGDFGRCEVFLSQYPELRADLPRMAEVNAYWAALVPKWGEIAASDDKHRAISAIVRPIEENDPDRVRIGEFASMRVGGQVDFKGKLPMKETAADAEVREKAFGIAADELRQFIERFEQLEAEKKDVAEQQKELMAEAKGRGYDTAAMKKIVALRKKKPDDVAEEEAILDLYKTALGME